MDDKNTEIKKLHEEMAEVGAQWQDKYREKDRENTKLLDSL